MSEEKELAYTLTLTDTSYRALKLMIGEQLQSTAEILEMFENKNDEEGIGLYARSLAKLEQIKVELDTARAELLQK